MPRLLGLSAVAFSALYLASDVVEAAQGGFSDGQLWLTLVAEAAIPPLAIGLWAAQRPAIGRLGLVSAVTYACAFVFFTYTVIRALALDIPDYDTLSDGLSPWMTIGGAVMVVAGIGFGTATWRAGVLWRWPTVALGVGVVAVAATQGAPEGVQVVAAAIRDLGVAGLGVATWRLAQDP